MNKLALGTVQFGLDYGVTNTNGQVSINEVENILTFAENNKIDTLDTASGYGNSEEVLGRIGVNEFEVITKTISIRNGVDNVIKIFQKSLKNLNVLKVKGLLIHDISDIENKQFDVLFKKINELKQKGLVGKIGFSTYTPEQVDFLLDNVEFDLIQVPFNVFDSRLIKGGQLQRLKNKGVEIHARSIFLQGLLLDFENLPKYFSTWGKEIKDYQVMVKKSSLSLLEYALNYSLGVKEIDKFLVGVDNVRQLQDIVKASQKKIDGKLSAFAINDIKLLNPSLWQNN